MNQKNKVMEKYVIWLADILCVAISFTASTWIRFGNFRDMESKSVHYSVLVAFVLMCTIYSFLIEWNTDYITRGYWREFMVVTRYNLSIFVVVEIAMFFFKWAETFSRLIMVYFLFSNILFTWIVHVLLKKYFYIYFKADTTSIKVMVIAEKENLQEVVTKLKDTLDLHYQVIACACMDESLMGQEIDGVPVIADEESLVEVARQMALDEVFISMPNRSSRKIESLVIVFDEMGIVCHRDVEASMYGVNNAKIETFGDFTVMSYVRFQRSYKKLLVKRVVDIAGSLVGLIITAVITPFVVIAIKVDDPGPAFFAQERVGRNGRRFKIYKFRSMYMDAEERKKELMAQNEVQGLMFKMENDPRITKVGKFIRKTSIDELPQFWNIFKGDMSLVGTRPPTVDEFEKYNPYYRRRLAMTPGLTGMWQVSGRSDIDNFDDVVKLDLKYIDNWSLGLDIKILLQTVLVVFVGNGSK